jgi:hypothetical protein
MDSRHQDRVLVTRLGFSILPHSSHRSEKLLNKEAAVASDVVAFSSVGNE